MPTRRCILTEREEVDSIASIVPSQRAVDPVSSQRNAQVFEIVQEPIFWVVWAFWTPGTAAAAAAVRFHPSLVDSSGRACVHGGAHREVHGLNAFLTRSISGHREP